MFHFRLDRGTIVIYTVNIAIADVCCGCGRRPYLWHQCSTLGHCVPCLLQQSVGFFVPIEAAVGRLSLAQKSYTVQILKTGTKIPTRMRMIFFDIEFSKWYTVLRRRGFRPFLPGRLITCPGVGRVHQRPFLIIRIVRSKRELFMVITVSRRKSYKPWP